MVSITLKRSAAALAVVAGVLAAAAPANAQRSDWPVPASAFTLDYGWPDGTLQNFNEVFALTTGPGSSTPAATFGGGLSRENFVANGP
jgi:hypothetical protein